MLATTQHLSVKIGRQPDLLDLDGIVQQDEPPIWLGDDRFQATYRCERFGLITCLAGRNFEIEIFLQIPGVEGEYDIARLE